MTRVEIAYRIELLTPLHIGTGMGFARMVDDMVVRAGPARGAGARLPCVPGSSVKGKARSRCEALARAMNLGPCGEVKCKNNPCVICRLFGSPFVAGTLHFSDALVPEEMSAFARTAGVDEGKTFDPFSLSTVRAGNKLERATRTVQPEFLFSIEHASEHLHLEGAVSGQIGGDQTSGSDAGALLAVYLLIAGLQSVDKIGGLRSRGLGRCRITIAQFLIEGKEQDPSPERLRDLLR